MSPPVPASPDVMPNFIIDAPASVDEIAAHDRLAEAIAKVVRVGKVKIIGVLGDWGSGKSTVIGLAQKRLEAKPDPIACFTFDAWQHQSDPQRRAFLEALVRFLEKSGAYSVPAEGIQGWRLQLERLNRQREETTTETLTHINRWTAAFAVSLLLLPLGIRLIGDGSLSVEDARDRTATLMFIAGWSLVALPLLLAGGFAILRDKLKDTAVYALLANKGPESKSETRLRDPEPSSMEFQRVFRLIVHEAAAHGPPLAIIVDNLDRLPPADAVNVWATVRSIFLGDDGMRDPDEAGLPTIMMPLDETAIRKIYATKEGAEVILARSFIEKTFDVVFHVPRPVLSRRHAYLAERLRGVFDDAISPVDVHAVGSVFEKHLSGGDPPSPRTINSFVNAIAVLAMQRADGSIPLPVIAHFVLNREEIAKDVRQWAIDHQDDLRTLGPNWQNDLAALHYGVGLDAAQELFIDEPLREAITKKDLDAIKRLSELAGFERYFIRCLDQARADDFSIPVFAAADILANLQLPGGWTGEAWNRLRGLSQVAVQHIPFQVDDEPGLRHLIASCEAPQRLLYLRGLASALRKAHGAEVAPPGAGDGIAALIKTLLGSANALEIPEFEIGVPGGFDVFVVMLVKDFSAQETRQLTSVGADLDALPGYLSRRLSDSLEALIVPEVVEVLCARGPDLDWTPLLAVARPQLSGHAIDAVAIAAKAVSFLFAGSPSAREMIQSWGHDGQLETAFSTVWQNSRDEAVPHITALQLRLDGRMPTSGDGWEGRLAANYDLVELTDDRLDALGVEVTAGWLFDRLNRYPEDTPLLREIFQHRVSTDRFPITQVFDQPQLLGRLFDTRAHDHFWVQAAADTEALTRFLNDETIDDAIPLLSALVRSGDRRQVSAAFKAAFARVTPDRWRHAIEAGDALYGLVRSRPGTVGRPPYLPDNVMTALANTLSNLTTTHDPSYRDRWYDVMARLWPQNQDALRDGIASELLDRPGSPTQIRDVLDKGGALLLSTPRLAAEANRTVSQLITPLIMEDEGRAWLYAHVDTVRVWIQKADTPLKAGLKDQLQAYRDSGYANAEDLRRSLKL